jgi:rhodanese-related sulfurtransferase
MFHEISAESLYLEIGLPGAAALVDVRSDEDCRSQPRLIPGAVRRNSRAVDTWAPLLRRPASIVVYCKRGGEVALHALQRLADLGYDARVLQGGLAAWMDAGYATTRLRTEFASPGGSRWVTRERPKIDRLACPWLIRRFIDPDAQFFYTPSHRVRADARALGAQPYDIAEVTFSHRGPRCSFDAFLDEFDLHDPVLDEVAQIVRAADTGALSQSAQAPGLLAISLGLSTNVRDDILLLEQAMPLYDALYAWRKKASHETHAWPQSVA